MAKQWARFAVVAFTCFSAVALVGQEPFGFEGAAERARETAQRVDPDGFLRRAYVQYEDAAFHTNRAAGLVSSPEAALGEVAEALDKAVSALDLAHGELRTAILPEGTELPLDRLRGQFPPEVLASDDPATLLAVLIETTEEMSNSLDLWRSGDAEADLIFEVQERVNANVEAIARLLALPALL